MDISIFKLMKNKILSNIIIFIFPVLGLILAFFKFELNIDSYSSLFITMATILATLVGFIGIFTVFRLQSNHANRSYYVKRVDMLKDKLSIYKISIITYKKDKIPVYITEVEKKIIESEEYIKRMTPPSAKDMPQRYLESINDQRMLDEIKFYLELINDINEKNDFSEYKDSFSFTIFNIFLFTIAIALCKIYFLNDDLIILLNYWRFINMPLTGFLFGLFYISLKDLSNLLKQSFI